MSLGKSFIGKVLEAIVASHGIVIVQVPQVSALVSQNLETNVTLIFLELRNIPLVVNFGYVIFQNIVNLVNVHVEFFSAYKSFLAIVTLDRAILEFLVKVGLDVNVMYFEREGPLIADAADIEVRLYVVPPGVHFQLVLRVELLSAHPTDVTNNGKILGSGIILLNHLGLGMRSPNVALQLQLTRVNLFANRTENIKSILP